MEKEGFEVLGVDYAGNKDKPAVKVHLLDLSTSWGRQALRKLIAEFQPIFVWFGTPCGTASRARDIRRKAGPDPKPLRSKLHPDGLPGLSQTDWERVQKANMLYQCTAELVAELGGLGISWAVENPTNSYM